jgi:hypothetical protein
MSKPRIFARMPRVMVMTGYGKSSIYEAVANGHLPGARSHRTARQRLDRRRNHRMAEPQDR